jgi:choline dehydrogenase-like flavoprotein
LTRPEYINLADAHDIENIVKCDICIIGAGAAGIYLAVELAAKSLDVILLEAGDWTNVDALTMFGSEVEFEADLYPGATKGRFFGVGGTTSHWGGALVPHTTHDLKQTDDKTDMWAHIVGIATKKCPSVLRKLGWWSGDDFTRFARHRLNEVSKKLESVDIDVSSNLILPIGKKNFRYLLNRPIRRGGRLRLVYNAVVRDYEYIDRGSSAHLNRIEAVSHKGRQIKIDANQFILSAGAIESARILLELDRTFCKPLFHVNSSAGCFLADHLSSEIAGVGSNDRKSIVNLFAPRFHKGWMRSFRFVDRSGAASTPRAFAHFIFNSRNSGFHLAKKLLGSMQARLVPKVTPMEALRGIEGIARLGIYRYMRSSLYIPTNAKVHLQLDVEQVSQRQNRVELGNKLDKFGRPVVSINWRITDQDKENIRVTARNFLAKWSTLAPHLPKLIPLDVASDTSKPHDAFHPVGTCRMGNKNKSVVDQNLRVWGLENLYVVSTGVLPSAGTANPTFTLLCLADDLIDRLTVGASRTRES